MLYSHDAVFRNVGFREVTSYKQAMAGSYQFYVTNANTFSVDFSERGYGGHGCQPDPVVSE